MCFKPFIVDRTNQIKISIREITGVTNNINDTGSQGTTAIINVIGDACAFYTVPCKCEKGYTYN